MTYYFVTQRRIRAHQGQELARGMLQVLDVRDIAEEPGLLQPEWQVVLRYPRETRRAPKPARAQSRARHCTSVSIF